MTGDYKQKEIFKIDSFVYRTQLINMCILYLLSNLLLSFISSGFLSIYAWYRIYQSSRIEQREPSTTDRNNSQQHVAYAD